MKAFVMLSGLLLLAACVTRTYEKETVIQKAPSSVQVAPTPRGATRSQGETTIIVPRQ